MSDTDSSELENDDEHGLAAEVARAQNNSTRENLKQSLAGWRQTAGMHANAAVAIDAVFLLIGAAMYVDGTGLLQIAGGILGVIGGLGLLETVWRRL